MLKVKLIAALLPVLATASPLYADQYTRSASKAGTASLVKALPK